MRVAGADVVATKSQPDARPPQLAQRRDAVLEFEIAGRIGGHGNVCRSGALDFVVVQPDAMRHAEAVVEQAGSLQIIYRRAAIVAIKLACQIDLKLRFVDVGHHRKLVAFGEPGEPGEKLESAALRGAGGNRPMQSRLAVPAKRPGNEIDDAAHLGRTGGK